MKRIGICLFFLLILFGIIYSIPKHFHKEPQIIVQHNIDTNKLWSLVQSWRQSQGLKPYIEDQTLCSIAQLRAEEIQTDFSHDQFHQHFDTGSISLSENLLRKYGPLYTATDEQDGLRLWLQSPTHLDNLKKPYLNSCLRCIDNKCAQEFSNFNTEHYL